MNCAGTEAGDAVSLRITYADGSRSEGYKIQVLINGEVKAFNIGSFIVADVVAAKYKFN